MKLVKFLITGVFFGIVLSKSQAISWYRIYEMFRFDSFHMYGIIGSAVILGTIIFGLVKKFNIKNMYGEEIIISPKKNGKYRNLLGGFIFGLGWALAGACPGPIYVLIGQGVFSLFIVLVGALLGTFIYHNIKHKLPH